VVRYKQRNTPTHDTQGEAEMIEIQEPKAELKGRSIIYTDCWGETEEITFTQYYARAFAIAHLHHNGVFRSFLSTAQKYECYKLADGFGPWDDHLEDYFKGGWDWSHVRDASWEAHELIAEYIISEIWTDNNLAEKVQECFDLAKQLDISPLQFLP
jgi:hypothetical protein